MSFKTRTTEKVILCKALTDSYTDEDDRLFIEVEAYDIKKSRHLLEWSINTSTKECWFYPIAQLKNTATYIDEIRI